MAQEEKNIDYTPDEVKNPAVGNSLPKADDVGELKRKLEIVEKEKDEYLNGWRRAKADLANYKNEELRRLEEVAKFGTEDMIRDVVRVLDSFDLALVALEKENKGDPATGSGQVRGISLIRGQLEDTLKRRGVEKIIALVGQPFDPALAESIGEVESKEVASGMVAEEIERGYLIHGKVLRPARVRLAR